MARERGASILGQEMAALRLLALERAHSLPEPHRQRLLAAVPMLTVLFTRYLVHDVQAPAWPGRDRFVVSGGFHPAICALLHLLGRDTGNVDEESSQTAEASFTPVCNPEASGLDLPMHMPGHGLAAAIGMALATRRLREEFGEGIDFGTYVLIDDLDVELGVAQEAIAIAPHLMPYRLTVLHVTPVRRDDEEEGRRRCPNHLARFAAAGWHVQQVRADDVTGIEKALEQAADQDTTTWQERRPAYVAVEYELAPLPDPQALRQDLGWQALPAGTVPEDVRDTWRLAGLRGRKAHKAWDRWLQDLDDARRAGLLRRLEGTPSESFVEALRSLRRALAEEERTRNLQALAVALAQHAATLRNDMLVLAATHGRLPDPAPLPLLEEAAHDKDAPPLPDIGLRPAALAALLAGAAAHGGFLPVGITQRRHLPAMVSLLEEAAAAALRLVLLLLDDDTCTQPTQALLPRGVDCLCPADAVELAECWQVALHRNDGPAVIVLPPGDAPPLRTTPEKTNLAALGAYEIHVSQDVPQGVVFAMGAPLAAAVRAAKRLETEDVSIRIVSVPAPERLLRQPADHVERIVGQEKVRLLVVQSPPPMACELLRRDGNFISPCDEDGRRLREEDLTAAIVRQVRETLAEQQAASHADDAANDE